MLRVLRAELRAKRAELERDRMADVASRALGRLSDTELVALRQELSGEAEDEG